jgi:hypothetical protein
MSSKSDHFSICGLMLGCYEVVIGPILAGLKGLIKHTYRCCFEDIQAQLSSWTWSKRYISLPYFTSV